MSPALRRAHVIAYMEGAIGEGIAVEDPTPDELLAAAERAGVEWIRVLDYVEIRDAKGYSVAKFEAWLKGFEEEAHVLR